MCRSGTQRAKYITWDVEKNERLKASRGIGFDDVVFHLERGDLLDILEHSNQARYSGQRIFVIQHEDYVTWCRSSRMNKAFF